MKIFKIQGVHKTNDIVLISNISSTRLLIRNINNIDLYFSIGNGVCLKKDENDKRFIEIRNTDKDVYEIIDKLYNSLLSIKDENKDYFDKDDNFIWFSNQEKKESSDYLVVSHNLDSYKLLFVRNNTHKEFDKKTIRSINIDLFASNSKNDDIVRCFFEMHKSLNKIGTTELLFTRKENKNE